MYKEIFAILLAASTLIGCTSAGEQAGSVGSRSSGPGAGNVGGLTTTGGPLDRGAGVTLAGAGVADRVLFAYDRWDLDAPAQQILRQQADWLRLHPGVAVTVEGHADERGTREYNLALGDRRAATVRSYLVAAGVPADRIRTVSYGKERPAVVGSNESSWSQNRRAVTVAE
jgi:peptidoglycan-associated lipoprotein